MCDSSSTTNASSSSSIVVSMDEDEDYISDSDCSYDSRREKEIDAANMLSSLRNVSGAALTECLSPRFFHGSKGTLA